MEDTDIFDDPLHEQEENIYSDEGRSEQMEDGEITPEEDAFMQGYDEADGFTAEDIV